MTREETKEWAESVVKHIFHRHHKKEVTINGYIARDYCYSLYCYERKPIKSGKTWSSSGYYWAIEPTLFLNVMWEDEEPTPVTITIKMK